MNHTHTEHCEEGTAAPFHPQAIEEIRNELTYPQDFL